MGASAGHYIVWVIVKRAPIREKPDVKSRVIKEARFGDRYEVHRKNREPTNGMMLVEWRRIRGPKRILMSGWVAAKALYTARVENYGRLTFTNETGRRVPVSKKHRSREICGYIEPGEQVAMIAKLGEWGLTSKGWTYFRWLTKDKLIFDQATLQSVYTASLAQAVKDYCRIIRNLKRTEDFKGDRFHSLMWQLDELVGWFLGEEYNATFDTVPGVERLDRMNEYLGIDKEWLRERYRAYQKIDRKAPRRRVYLK